MSEVKGNTVVTYRLHSRNRPELGVPVMKPTYTAAVHKQLSYRTRESISHVSLVSSDGRRWLSKVPSCAQNYARIHLSFFSPATDGGMSSEEGYPRRVN